MATTSSTPQSLRFGQLSRNQFFARHNPHPNRVCHMNGLWGQPICTVRDDPLAMPNFQTHPGTNVLFPPQNFNDYKVGSSCDRIEMNLPMPVGLSNMSGPSRTLPIDTISALQYFTGLQNYSFKEKAVPYLGMLPVTDTWRQELRNLTTTIVEPFNESKRLKEAAVVEAAQEQCLQHPAQWLNKGAAPAIHTGSHRTPLYSPATGRLIPPSSRNLQSRRSRTQACIREALSSAQKIRVSSRGHSAGNTALPAYDHISLSPDMEAQVFTMLCGILQTEDVQAVQAWLSSASEREKSLVTSIIQAALCNKEEYSHINPDGQVKDVPPTAYSKDGVKLPPIVEGETVIGASDTVNRLIVHADCSNDETAPPPISSTFEQKVEQPAVSSSQEMPGKHLTARPRRTPTPLKSSRNNEPSAIQRAAHTDCLKIDTPSDYGDVSKSRLATPFLMAGNAQTTWNPDNSLVKTKGPKTT